jgi:large subunit ribosomal protein L21
MYAVIEFNKNQYLVKDNEEIIVDRIDPQEKKLVIKNVLLYKDDHKLLIGKPYIEHASVHAEVVEEMKGKKIVIFKYKRRKNYKKKMGHRQLYTVLKIKEIKTA